MTYPLRIWSGTEWLLVSTDDGSVYATAAQGALADTALQSGDVGTAAYTASTAYATAAQGATADAALATADAAAPLSSPTFTGVPAAPTAAAATDTTQVATTAYTRTAIPNVLNASGSAPIYACRAWVNFNGTGTVAIREAGNVSSITDNGTGKYTVNFTTAMPDANYAALTSSDGESRPAATYALTASSVSVETASGYGTYTPTDKIFISVAVFR